MSEQPEHKELTERLVEGIGKQMDRRSFLSKLGKLGVGAVGVLLGVAVTPQKASALYDEACCHLCNPPSTSCSGCSCSWCWTCADCTQGGTYRCCECHNPGGYCGSGCTNVICSSAKFVGPSCR